MIGLPEPKYMDNPPAVGATDKEWKWGFLPCGCYNDGFGHHLGTARSNYLWKLYLDLKEIDEKGTTDS